MFVMMHYFEPQILYGMTRPTKNAAMSSLAIQWKTATARQSLPTLLYGGFIKWHHTAVRDCQEKNSRSIERLFFLFLRRMPIKKAILLQKTRHCVTSFLYITFLIFLPRRESLLSKQEK